jgi:hypothetical protein
VKRKIDTYALRDSPQAVRLRDAAVAWVAARKSGPTVLREDDAEFAFTFDAELLEAASAYDAAVRCAREPHADMVYGLRLMLDLAERRVSEKGFPPARGKASTRQRFSLSRAKAWIETLPKRGRPL